MKVAEFDVTLSYVALLLEEQRYDEALPILGTLMDMNPSDREARMYRLLVLRILVQRYHLSNPTHQSMRNTDAIAKRLLVKLANESSEGLRWFGRMCHVTQPLLIKAAINRLTIAVAACSALATPLAFFIGGGYGIEHRSQASFIDASYLTISAVDLKGHNAKDAAASGSELASDAEAWNVTQPTSEETHVKLPVVSWTEIVPFQNVARVERRFRTDSANPMRHFETRRAVPKRREFLPATNIQKKTIVGKETRPIKTRKTILAQYQSERTVPVRQSASFAAGVVQEIATGTLVSVLEVHGSWAKVEIGDRGITGFVRTEFLTPVNLGRMVES
jgi:hypothetical protein